MSKYITSTAYPIGLNKIAIEYRDAFRVVEACGSNLDAPEIIISGGLFWGSLCRKALPAVAYARGVGNNKWNGKD